MYSENHALQSAVEQLRLQLDEEIESRSDIQRLLSKVKSASVSLLTTAGAEGLSFYKACLVTDRRIILDFYVTVCTSAF